MKVYIVLGATDYEGETILSVHSTKLAAELAAMDPDYVRSWEYVYVEEHEVHEEKANE